MIIVPQQWLYEILKLFETLIVLHFVEVLVDNTTQLLGYSGDTTTLQYTCLKSNNTLVLKIEKFIVNVKLVIFSHLMFANVFVQLIKSPAAILKNRDPSCSYPISLI